MRRLALLALFVAAAPAAAMQTAQRPLSAVDERPAEVVARMAREAMGLPADPAGWSALADALPELALLGGADLESTFDAARIADSLSVSALSESALSPSALGAASGSIGPKKLMLLSTLLKRRWMDAVLAFLVTGAGGAGVLLFHRRQKRAAALHGGDRVGAARSLATSGLSVHEIARRTGMAQDAVHVLMGLAGSTPMPFTHARTRVPPRAVESRASGTDLQQAARLAKRRLRDRRLTYGPGARA